MNVRLETLKASEMSLAVSRGFANISKSLLAVNKCFTKGGRFYHMKGSNWSTEIAEIPTQIISLWSPELVGEYTLPDTQARRGVVCTTKN
jgi:16S rRNA (guanine527-N7)-methyltransferase